MSGHRLSVLGLGLVGLGLFGAGCDHDSMLAVRVAPSATPVPSAEVSVATPSTVSKPTHPNVKLFDRFYDFAVASPPDPDHPKGTIAVFASRSWSDCEAGLAEIDLATLSELGHFCLGKSDRSMIASAEHGVVVAEQVNGGLTVTWLDGVKAVRAKRSVPKFGAVSKVELYGLAVVAGRAVALDDQAHAYVVDEGGKFVAPHKCAGMFPHPGFADVVAWGDRAVVTSLRPAEGEGSPSDRQVCAFRADGSSATDNVRFPEAASSSVFVDRGDLYLGYQNGPARRLGAGLRPEGAEVHFDPDAAVHDGGVFESWSKECPGITGGVLLQSKKVEGVWLVRTAGCCGDESPGGFFVCGTNVPPT